MRATGLHLSAAVAADIRPQLVQHTEVATKAIRRRITLIREAGFSAHPSEQLLAEVKLWRGAFLSDAGVSVEKLRRITKGQMDWVVDELEKQLQRTTEGTLDGSALPSADTLMLDAHFFRTQKAVRCCASVGWQACLPTSWGSTARCASTATALTRGSTNAPASTCELDKPNPQ
ncbi:hypothetical protein DMC30DRAFT_84660 [Rhodotorula diobovata]|uniref:Uncharacterized protein n=1 Tax=Rhodotorula diobovata TaxID=5288 RepID=A0A5C5FPP2_9BASI|nr:hypothetical protein DMC30DRAFT_84660 [Rhodotorula diobovata]